MSTNTKSEGYRDIESAKVTYHRRSEEDCPLDCCEGFLSCHCCGLCILVLSFVSGMLYILQGINTINTINSGSNKSGSRTWIMANGNCIYTMKMFNREQSFIFDNTECTSFIPVNTALVIASGITILVSIIGLIGIVIMKPFMVLIATLIPILGIFVNVWLTIYIYINCGKFYTKWCKSSRYYKR